MPKRFVISGITALLVVAAVGFFAYEKWGRGENSPRDAMLAAVPAGSASVFFADAAELRQSRFLAQLYSWAAPAPQIDDEYAQFLRETGFDYERDLDRVAVAAINRANHTAYFAIADGRFDRKKLVVYASQSGTHEKQSGHEVLIVPLAAARSATSADANASALKISFAFLSSTRLALTTDNELGTLLTHPVAGQDAKDWRERFDRLAGSPIFAVIRQEASPGSALATHAPGGLQSPQLATLLNQLQWITIAGKPEGDRLRVVAEGESADDGSARQLSDMLNGILLLAQAGLNGPQIRGQLDPHAREAYLDLLKTADVSRIDRRETKSVRLVFEVSPKFLAAAGTAAPTLTRPAPPRPVPPKSKPQPKKSPASN